MSTAKVKAALTRRLGPLPAWAWLALLAVGIYWWRHRAAAAAAVAAGTAAGVPAGAGSGIGTSYYDSGGGGGGAAQPSDLNPLVEPFGVGAASWDPLQQPAGDTTGAAAPVPPPPATGPATPPPASPLRGPGMTQSLPLGHNVQAPGGSPGSFVYQTSLQWGGRTFTTQTAFNSWLTARGGTLAQFMYQHPEAYGIYMQLHPGGAPTPAPKAEQAPHAEPRAQQPAAKAAVVTAPRPVSVRPVKAAAKKKKPEPVAASRVKSGTKAAAALAAPPARFGLVSSPASSPVRSVAAAAPAVAPYSSVGSLARAGVGSGGAVPVVTTPALAKPATHAPTSPAPTKVAPVVPRTSVHPAKAV